MKRFHQIAFLALLAMGLSSCGGECKTFGNSVPSELPPNLKFHLGGVLNNEYWLLTNSQGDSIEINTTKPKVSKVGVGRDGGSSECSKIFYVRKEIQFKFNSVDRETSNFKDGEISIVGDDMKELEVSLFPGRFYWNLENDSLLDPGKGGFFFPKLITIEDSTYSNVLAITKKSVRHFIYHPESGYLAYIDHGYYFADNHDTLTLKSYY